MRFPYDGELAPGSVEMVFVLVVFAGLLVPTSSRSSEAALWSVAQVIQVGEELRIEQVPFVDYFDLPSCAGGLAFLTTAPNALMVSGKPQNRNAANLLGVRIELVAGPAFFGDTLHVQMDLSGIDERSDSTGHRWLPADEIVPLTVECLRRNVRACGSDVRHLAVHVVGDVRYECLTGTFDLRARSP